MLLAVHWEIRTERDHIIAQDDVQDLLEDLLHAVHGITEQIVDLKGILGDRLEVLK